MFDLVRLAVLVWAAMSCLRMKLWTFVLPTAFALYLLFLGVFSGFTIRDEGPRPPAEVMLLIFLGPSDMPRGPLPSLPLANLATQHAQLLDAASALFLFAASQLLTRRADELPELAAHAPSLHRAELSLTFAAVVTALATLVVALPLFLDPTP